MNNRFFFGDKVKIIKGFYVGIEGMVTDYKSLYFGDCGNGYYFEGYYENENSIGVREIKTWIVEENLIKLEK